MYYIFTQVSLNIYKCINIVDIIEIKILFYLFPKALCYEISYGENIKRICLLTHLVHCYIKIDICKFRMMVEMKVIQGFPPNGILLD